MALTLLRFFEAKTPLLPVAVVVPAVVCSVADKLRTDGNKDKDRRAVAATMPPSAEDYVWTYTESGEASLRPVVVCVGGGGTGNRDTNVAGAF